MSPTSTTTRAALRRAGILLMAAALVGGPVGAAFADPTGEPSTTATSAPPETSGPGASAEPSASASASPSASATQSAPSSPAPSSGEGTGSTAPGPSVEDEADPSLVPGGSARSFGPMALAGPATSTDPTLVAADYLERELVSSDYTLPIVFSGTSYPQYGLVADAILALDAAGAGQDAAAAATAVLADNVASYVGYDDGDPTTPDDVYAGPVAKLLNVALAQGVDPTAFGGYDLLNTLKGLETSSGRFSDVTSWTDYSNTFGQSFALIGLQRAGETVSTNARTFLLDQQCTDGGFRLNPGGATCTSDPDATAMAVQALLAVGSASAAAADGLDYLAGLQQSSGGIGGAGPTSGVNANTTGLAGQAFLAGGRTAQARAAVTYLTGLQYGCDFPAVLRGGIAYDRAAYLAQDAAGTAAEPQDQDRRSTSQALLALAGTPLAAVTAAGADAEAPSLTCATPTSSGGPTSTGGSSSPSTTGGPTDGAGSGGNETTGPLASGPLASGPGSLAQTGSDLLWPATAGLVLLVVGGLAVAASRRRGAHA